MNCADFLLEIGCEEIPAGVAPAAAQALLEKVQSLLDVSALAHGELQWLATPRRLTVHVKDLALRQADRSEIVTGPPARAAKDPAGNWSKAAEGFAKGQGVELSELFETETPKGPYVAANKTHIGQPTALVLADNMPEILRTLPLPKRMRWGRNPQAFVRPLHWIVALLGADVVPFEFAGVPSGNCSRGHRFYADQPVLVLADLGAYQLALLDAKVMVDPAARKNVILRGIHQLAAEVNGSWVQDDDTLQTVTFLVEWPAPLLGEFDPDYLQIPAPVIQTTLRENQKLFTLTDKNGALLPNFIAVANTLSEQSRATVALGNARVVSARLSDARFFHREDTKEPLETKLAALAGRMYLNGLGTLADKVARIEAISLALAANLGLTNTAQIQRAAHLCKADLSTRMVFEFPELQGLVGGDYARISGEDPAVATAIEQHYRPRFAGDALPAGDVAAIVAIADKIDSIVGCFALGLLPTGTQDPYALRRAALGVLRIVEAQTHWKIGLSALLELAVTPLLPWLPQLDQTAVLAQVLQFFRVRLASLHSADYPTDLVEAVLEVGFDSLVNVAARLRALDNMRQGADFAAIAAAFKRVANIVRKSGQDAPDRDAVRSALFEKPAETQLNDQIDQVQMAVDRATALGLYSELLQNLRDLKPAVDAFFDQVMVMVDDVPVRNNRLALLKKCAYLFQAFADFSKLQADLT